MRKVFWCGIALTFAAAATIYGTCRYASGHPDSCVGRCVNSARYVGTTCNPIFQVARALTGAFNPPTVDDGAATFVVPADPQPIEDVCSPAATPQRSFAEMEATEILRAPRMPGQIVIEEETLKPGIILELPPAPAPEPSSDFNRLSGTFSNDLDVLASPAVSATAESQEPPVFMPPCLDDNPVPTKMPYAENMDDSVSSSRQIMLRMTFAEVDRAAARSIGLAADSPSVMNDSKIPLAMDALRRIHLARILAEPTMVTLDGHKASFQAGGVFTIPLSPGVALAGCNQIPYGLQLNVTPSITAKDRIFLEVDASVGIRAVPLSFVHSGNDGTPPGVTTRSVRTTVEISEGDTLAIANLQLMPKDPIVNCGSIVHRGEWELVLLVSAEVAEKTESELKEPHAKMPKGTEPAESDACTAFNDFWLSFVRDKPSAIEMPSGVEESEPSRPGDPPNCQEDPYHDHQYPGCPFTGQCPVWGRNTMPDLELIGRPRRIDSQGDSEESEEPFSPPSENPETTDFRPSDGLGEFGAVPF